MDQQRRAERPGSTVQDGATRPTGTPGGESGQSPGVVIVGAGISGVQTAVALREQGWEGSITLLGAEPHQPYDRPPLSKAVLLGKAEHSAFEVDFEELDVDLRLGCEVTALRPAEHLVETEQGPVPYTSLVLATGAEPVTLPGTAGIEGVHLLRTLDDAARLRPVLERRHRVVVVGAGWIGAEFATAARESGCEVTVVEASDFPLAGALPREVAAPMVGWYAEAGAELRTTARVSEIAQGVVVLQDGTRLETDAVVVGIGARPATGWLRDSGVALGAGGEVVADRYLRTSVPDVHAVGDCASFPSRRYARRLLIHHWDNALQGPRTVAASIVGESPAEYDPVPYFWSEQFGRFVQYAGDHATADAIVWRGEPHEPAWSVCWLQGDRLVALLAVGRPRDLAQGRRLVQSGTPVDPERLADVSRPLKSAVR